VLLGEAEPVDGRLFGHPSELALNIGRIEQDYDNVIFNNKMGELRQWLEDKGVRLD